MCEEREQWVVVTPGGDDKPRVRGPFYSSEMAEAWLQEKYGDQIDEHWQPEIVPLENPKE